ncbi:hypothetical protein Trco_001254 [Trichoderma cornu-damae]|uniref:Uncharacterized protein n=1 Tax=Trichoderma cornu-damae TaxID=654480 RepID=A0A9P8QTY8_9HYPO|nr:hypothetical protein Trco_001254 [Trichoderma cornu-damae]
MGFFFFQQNGVANGAGAQSADEVALLGGLGLDIIRQVVGVVAREVDTSRHGLVGLGREDLLDVVLVVGVDNGGDVEVGQSVPAAEGDLAEHARDVGSAVLDGIEVALPGVGEGDGGVLLAVDGDGFEVGLARVAGEVDGALNIVQSPEGDAGGAGQSRGSNQGSNRSSETHFEDCVFA